MSTTSLIAHRDRIELTPKASERVLDGACRSQARAVIRCADTDVEIHGKLEQSPNGCISIKTGSSDLTDDIARLSDYSAYDVEIQMDGEPFWFAAETTSVENMDGQSVITLPRPAVISMRQRRLFWRARIKESATVTVAPINGDEITAMLLNISDSGLACRANQDDASQMAIGTTCVLTFSLDQDSPTIRVSARLKGTSPASENLHAILRFQFDQDSMTEESRREIAKTMAANR
jgi:PilZ domain-containing protein